MNNDIFNHKKTPGSMLFAAYEAPRFDPVPHLRNIVFKAESTLAGVNHETLHEELTSINDPDILYGRIKTFIESK